MDLNQLRVKISGLDSELVKLLNERAFLAQKVGEAKMSTDTGSGIDVFVPSQEKNVITRISSNNPGPLTKESLESIYREIISASISLQKQISIGYLGPFNSFCHLAAQKRFGSSIYQKPYSSVEKVFEAVENGDITYGIVPFESSGSGIIEETFDSFEEYRKPVIRAELNIATKGVLASHFQLENIKRIYSHKNLFIQCDNWLRKNCPNADRVLVSSSSRAAQLASSEMYTCAICSKEAADSADLPVISSDIQNVKTNYMRYVVIGQKIDENITDSDRTLISFTVDHKMPGSLCSTLQVFKENDINLTKIDTRTNPKKLKLFQYVFYVELQGHSKDPKISSAIQNAGKYCVDLRIIGSYTNNSVAE